MNKDQALGIARELGTALGVALVTFGVTTSSTVELVLGVLIAIVSLVFALKTHEGSDIIVSLARKILSGLGGGLVAFGALTPEKAEALAAVVLVVVSTTLSFHKWGGGPPAGGNSPLWIFALLALCLCPGCTTVTERITAPDGTVTERTIKSVDGAAFAAGANAVTAIAAPRAVLAEK